MKPETLRPGKMVPARQPYALPATLAAGLYLSYVLAFALTGTMLGRALIDSAVNVVALVVSGAVLFALARLVRPDRLSPFVQFAFHVPVSVAFAFLWYLLIIVGFAIGGDWLRGGLVARAFGENAIVWQIFQGVTLYAVILLLIERHNRPMPNAAMAEAVPPDSAVEQAGPLLLKDGNEIVAVALDEIVRISGAGSYVEIATLRRTFGTARTLGSLEAALPPAFLRVHRSHIVRQGAIVRAEPAGNGRLTLHLSDSQSITTSRDGARLIRERAA